MLPEFYHKCFSKLLTSRQYTTLQIVIFLLQSYKTVQIEKLSALFTNTNIVSKPSSSSSKVSSPKKFKSKIPLVSGDEKVAKNKSISSESGLCKLWIELNGKNEIYLWQV